MGAETPLSNDRLNEDIAQRIVRDNIDGTHQTLSSMSNPSYLKTLCCHIQKLQCNVHVTDKN